MDVTDSGYGTVVESAQVACYYDLDKTQTDLKSCTKRVECLSQQAGQ